MAILPTLADDLPPPYDQPVPNRLRIVVLVWALLVFSNGPLFFISVNLLHNPARWEDRFVRFSLVAGGLLVAACVVAEHWPGSRRDAMARTGLFAPNPIAAAAIYGYTMLAVLSTLWSVQSDLTLWRSLVYLALPLLAWLLADPGTQLRTPLAWFTGIAVGVSLVIVVLWPHLGLDRNDDWRGLYTNRNSLAPLAALAFLVGLRWLMVRHPIQERSTQLAFGALLILASLVVLVGSGSRTAWMALIAALGLSGCLWTWTWLRDRWRLRWAGSAMAGLGGLGLLATILALQAVWQETTFMQRRIIWGLVWERIAERPWHGYGFFVFWDLEELTWTHQLLQRGSAHNSLLEVALGLGLLGTVPFVIIVVLAARNAARGLLRKPDADSWLWAAVVGFVLLENISESFVLWFSYNWVIVMAAALARPTAGSSVRVARGASAVSVGSQ